MMRSTDTLTSNYSYYTYSKLGNEEPTEIKRSTRPEHDRFISAKKCFHITVVSLALFQLFLIYFIWSKFIGVQFQVFSLKGIKLYFSDPHMANINVNSPDVFYLSDSFIGKYFKTVAPDILCFIHGIDESKSYSEKGCVCNNHYYGTDCGIPFWVWNSTLFDGVRKGKSKVDEFVKRRSKPRRIIYALPVNHEFDLLEARIHMLYDVVDVFLVGESNYTNTGEEKPQLFLEKFRNGWLKQFQDKISYVFQNKFPEEGKTDGVIADASMRRTLSQQGFKQLSDVRLDDLLIYTDADEIPRQEILFFLKLYDGYPQPIAFHYIWSIFGFYWQVDPVVHGHYKGPEPAGIAVQFFRDVYSYDASCIRGNEYEKFLTPDIKNLYKTIGQKIETWKLYRAGWHCSWCFKPEGIRKKLLNAPKSDYPRYGDYPGKTTLSYIRRLIKNGIYFDLNPIRNGSSINVEDDPDYAPEYILNNKEKYSYLLVNPYFNVSLPRVSTNKTNAKNFSVIEHV